MHEDVSVKTYTDFGQNKGRYAVGNTNALLQYLNKDGVQITYTGGQAAYTMEHGMIDFDSQVSSGEGAAIGYNFIATAAHVDTPDWYYNGGLMDFTRNNLGRSNSVLYTGIEYKGTSFLLKPQQDYKITRLSKLVTDVTCSTVYGAETGDYSGITERELAGELLYRSGSGHMYYTDHEGNRNFTANAYTYITGGIDTIASIPTNSEDGCYSVQTFFTYTGEEVGVSEPLPYKAHEGDSGSPSWVWNEQTQQYEYIAALQSGNEVNYSQFRGNCEWTNETMASFDVNVTVGSEQAIYLNAITGVGELVEDSSGLSTTLRYGLVTDAEGTELARYNGVVSGTHTWKDLSGLKNTDNWYNYGDEYLNATEEASSSAAMTWAELFHNNNLVIAAASATETQQVVLKDTVDLGIGYVQFSLGEGMERADFVVTSEGAESNLLNSAGYVVDKGVSVHLQLTNPADYVREWRKVGEGDLYIEGSGNNDVFLNLGGDGATYLSRTNGYAAWNVLANNGSTVVIDDVNQIARDFTFGNRGGVLDMNGNSMVWNNDNGAGADGFTIHALDEGAVVANRAEGTHTVLTWTQGGTQTWLGSFADTDSSALTFAYDGGGVLTMHSILTDLQHADSGVAVQSGKVVLVGTNTVHALGSQGSFLSSARYSSDEDWHYADARMNVSVASGATFELGSHARLTGDVTVASGGTYVMREGVKHRMEYIEGGYVKEDTDSIRAFFGHKGNVSLASGASMQVAFSEGTDSTLVYEGNISGAGSLSVDAQGGILKLGGTNTFSGTKQLVQGGLWAASNAALGDTTTNKWVIGERAWLASDGFTDASQILGSIDGSSTGVLALSKDVAGQIELSGHTELIIGAAEGCDVRYGSASESLSAVNGQWVLGGGGGNLEVLFKLSGQNDLVLGNAHGTGNVHLSNTDNDFSGDIRFVGGVTLSYDEGALGNAMIDLSYGNRALLTASDMKSVKAASPGVAQGVVLVDRMLTADIDLSAHTGLALGAAGDVTYSGNITLAEGNPYRFGGGDGCLTVATALASGHDMVIDGQGYSGGSVVLSNAQNFSGHVAITGGTGGVAGDVTLRFTADNSMSAARGFSLSNGGRMDLAGTYQQLAGVELASGGSILDSSAERSSTLTLLSGSIGSGSVVDVAHVVKSGTGTLTLGNSTNNFSDFSVEGGTLLLSADAKGAFRVGAGAVYDMNGCNATGSVTLAAGATLQNVRALSAALRVQGASTLKCASGGTELSAAVSVDAGAELTVQAGSASFSLGKNSSLTGEGNVSITTSNTSAYNAVSLGGDNSAFSGRLSISGNGSNAAYFGSVAAFGSGTVALDNIAFSMNDYNTAATAVAATLEIGSGGSTFRGGFGDSCYFSGLSGSGTLRSASYGDGSIWFAGNVSSFGGTLDNDSSNLADDTLRFGFGGSGVNYHSVTGSNSADAVALFAEGARLRASGASVTYEFQYADRVALNATVEDGAHVTQSGSGTLVLGAGNSSTGTLSINSGSVELAEGSNWAGALAGSGTLINRNTQAVTISSAAGFSGSLGLVQGSSLSLGTKGNESFSLGAGQQLSLLAGATAGATPAELRVSSLVLNGGSLEFSGEALAQGGVLDLGQASISMGANAGKEIAVSFFDSSALTTTSYKLMTGQFGSLSGSEFSASGLDECFTASFSVANNELSVTLSGASGHSIWVGSESSWNTGFGGSTPATSDTVWFNDAAAEKNVLVSASRQNVAALVFNASEEYSLGTSSGDLTAGTLELRAAGKVTLGKGVYISGTTTLSEGSELVVNDYSSLSGTVSGSGTLSIDTGAAAGYQNLSGLGTLQILSGLYNATGTLGAKSVVVKGGQLYLAATNKTHTLDFTLSGDGWTDNLKEDVDAAALRVVNNTYLKGSISLASDTGIAVDGGSAYLQGKLQGQGHTLAKTGSGTLWLDTANSFAATDVSFVVEQGGLRLGRIVSNALPQGIASITVQSGAWLGLQSNSGTLATNLVLGDKATLDLASGVTNTARKEYSFTGNMELGGDAAITTAMSRALAIEGTISGSGGLQIEGNGALELALNGANSFEGGITIARSGVTLTLGCAEAAGTGAIVLGDSTALMKVSGNADGSYGSMVNAVSGAGSVELSAGRLSMSGSNSYGGSTTVKEGAVLSLSAANSGSSAYVVEKGAQLLLSGSGFVTTADKGVTLRARITASGQRSRALPEGALENVTLTDVLMTNTDSTVTGRVSNTTVEVDTAAFALSGLELSNTTVQANSGASALELTDLMLDSASSVQGEEGKTWALTLKNVILSVSESPTSVSDLGGFSNVSLYSLTNFTNVSLAGDLLLDVASLPALASTFSDTGATPGYIAFDFGDSVSIDELSLSAVYAGSTMLTQVGVSDSVVLFSTSAAAVPEPAGSALCLLGLGALALRRRRR